MEETTGRTDARGMYLAGLISGMREISRGLERAHAGRDWLLTSDEAPTLARSYAEGDADADDDSDEPRPDDAAALQAMAREVFDELERIGATVSAWPDYQRGHLRLDDGFISERHDPETLLATLRSLPEDAGSAAMWEATKPIALACLTWNACVVVTDAPALSYSP